jgi:hypothetical protein
MQVAILDMCRRVFKRYKYPHIKIAPNLYDQVLSNLPRSKSIINLYKKQKLECLAFEFFWRRHPDLNWGMRLLQSLALPLGYDATWSERRGSNSLPPPWQGGALPDELRSHIWCLRAESNHRHGDFQSPALPTELQRHNLATRNGLEPSTSSVTG